jgi:hypothetical protein
MIRLNLQNEAEVARAVAGFARATGRDIGDQIVAMARLVAVSLAASTQPYGTGKASQELGKKRVSADIHRVFGTPSSIYETLMETDAGQAVEFWKAHKANDDSFMQEILHANGVDVSIANDPSPMIHAAARTKRGGVHKNYRMRQLVLKEASLKRYIIKRQKMVGFAKAGWAKAADACGGHRGIPAWASSKHPTAPGGARITRDAIRPLVVLENRVNYVTDILPPREIEGAIDIAFQRAFKQMKAIIAANARKARLASRVA